MNKKTTYILLLITMMFLAACQPDPRRDADAFATRTQAEIQAAAAQQQLQQKQDLHNIRMQQLQALQVQWIAAKNRIIRVGGFAGAFALGVILIALGASLAVAIVGRGQASARADMVRANTIYLDPVTRQFPLFLQHVHGTRFALVNPNVGSVTMLDVAKEADRQMISTSGATQIAGVLASEAAKSKDPGGMAMIRPPIVFAQTREVTVGAEYWQNPMGLSGEDGRHEIQK